MKQRCAIDSNTFQWLNEIALPYRLI